MKVPHAKALRLAEKIRDELGEGCAQIEIAGSIRRGVPDVSDVELVAVPSWRPALFGDGQDFDLLDEKVAELVALGALAWRDEKGGIARRAPPMIKPPGRRFYRLVAARSGVKVDLFVVRPPATWGAILAIRTGSALFSRALVTRAAFNGLRVADGRVLTKAAVELDTSTEAGFFRAVGVPYVAPESRTDAAAAAIIRGSRCGTFGGGS